MDTDPASTVAPARSGRSVVVAIIVASLLAAATVIVFRSSGGADPVAARVPDDVSSYVQANLNPSLSQKRLAEGLASKLPGGEADIERAIDMTLASALRAGGVEDREGVEAWRGDELAVARWGEPSSTFLVIQAEDQEAASAWVDEQNRRSAQPIAEIRTGFVTVSPDGDLSDFQEEAAELSLFRDKAFRSARDRVGGDGVLLARAQLSELNDLPIPGVSEALAAREGSLVAGVSLVEGGLELTVTEADGFLEGPLPAPASMDLLAELAEHADLAVAVNDLAALVRPALEASGARAEDLEANYGLDLEGDVLSWLQGVSAFRVAWIDGEPRATVVIEASDEDAMRSFVSTARALAAIAGEEQGVRIQGRGPDSFEVRTEDVEALVTIDGARLTIEVAPVGARGSFDAVPSLLGIPSGDASVAGAIRPSAISMLVGSSEPDQDLALIESIGFSGVADEDGSRFSLKVIFKEAA